MTSRSAARTNTAPNGKNGLARAAAIASRIAFSWSDRGIAERSSDRADTGPADVLDLQGIAPGDMPNVLISLNRMTRAEGISRLEIDTANHISGLRIFFIS